MNTKTQVEGGFPDAIKWALAVAILAAGVVAFYMFPEQSQLYRVIGVLVAAGVSIAIAGQTARGREAFAFMREARNEVRKVVWPTRKETIQTTGLVFVVVIIVAIMLWGLDSFLGWAVGQLLGWGS